MITAHELCTKAMSIYLNRDNWTYCQGGLGELGESTRIKGLYEYYYKQPNRSKYMTLPYAEWLAQYGKGKQCTDCSNFINVLLGYTDNYYSVWRLGTLPAWQGELKDAPAGTVLWMQGHVGLSLGNGKWMDMPHYNTTYRMGSWEPAPLWEKAVYLPEVEYEAPVRLEVEVTDRKRKVGDSVSYADFTVKNVYADGSKKFNTSYNYTPGIITYDECQIAITYDTLVAYARISAERSGQFYAVMLPARSAQEALDIQRKVIDNGLSADSAIVQI